MVRQLHAKYHRVHLIVTRFKIRGIKGLPKNQKIPENPVHRSSAVAMNKNIVFGRDRGPIKDFLRSIHHIERTAAKNKNNIFFMGFAAD